MKTFYINNIPCALYGEPAKGVYLYVHGQRSCKEAAESFAEVVCAKGWQVLSVDLPEHGERKGERNMFYAWNVVPELQTLLQYAQERWERVALRAHSIGAYFSMMSFSGQHFENIQLVSPILDMQKLCEDMMEWAGVLPTELKEKKFIDTNFGQTLCWEEYEYARKNPMRTWQQGSVIMYGEMDNLTNIETVKGFVWKFQCGLTVLQGGEHWFHTPEQLAALRVWTEQVTPELL